MSASIGASARDRRLEGGQIGLEPTRVACRGSGHGAVFFIDCLAVEGQVHHQSVHKGKGSVRLGPALFEFFLELAGRFAGQQALDRFGFETFQQCGQLFAFFHGNLRAAVTTGQVGGLRRFDEAQAAGAS